MALDDDQRKHLDYIQAAISRMSTDSFLTKGWSLTVAAAIFGYAASRDSWRVAAVGLLPAFVFWGLDAYYLWHERLFRRLYVEAAAGRVSTYSMDIAPYKRTTTWRGTLVSRTIWPIYLLIVVVGVALVVDGVKRPSSTPSHSRSKAALMTTSTSS
jgi:hypothetical protein